MSECARSHLHRRGGIEYPPALGAVDTVGPVPGNAAAGSQGDGRAQLGNDPGQLDQVAGRAASDPSRHLGRTQPSGQRTPAKFSLGQVGASPTDDGLTLAAPGRQLFDEAGLPDPGLAGNDDELRPSGLRLLPVPRELSPYTLASDDRGEGWGGPTSAAGTEPPARTMAS